MPRLSDSAPFVLFEDARPGGGEALVFQGPREMVLAETLDEVEPALSRLRAGLREGQYAAGWLSYEAGFALEPRLKARAGPIEPPLLWFGLFESACRVSRQQLQSLLPDGCGAWLSEPRPRMTRAAYEAAFARAQRYIEAGDVYQINLSYRADLDVIGDPLAAYARLRRAGAGGWSGIAFSGERWLLSTSPELFFRLERGVIEARPMKGTARRGATPEEDARAAARLASDPKELAENVMIVDLLRNDISRIARRGSVRAPELFRLETYPTLHALTSTVRAEMGEGRDAIDALLALFPCGSITGAPKIRAMEIISELETDMRGAYTGSIGWMGPDGSAEFNVAIRTITLRQGRAEVGLGSAVVHDSTAAGEWEECRAKAGFITADAPRFGLIETMRVEAGRGVARLDLHLARLERSARTFGFVFDRSAVMAALEPALASAGDHVLRLSLRADGAVLLERRPLPQFPETGARVRLAPLPVDRRDFRLRHKTTLRDFYDAARAQSEADEVVFVDAAGFVTEGSLSNVFLAREGTLLTPPAARGLLPGVLRADLLASGRAREAELTPSDLAGGFLIGNAVRGLTPARLLPARAEESPYKSVEPAQAK